MLLDRLGNRVERGSLLFCDDFRSLVAVSRVAAVGSCHEVYGTILEWEWDFYIGEDRVWGTLRYGIHPDYEIVGWYRR